MKINVSLSISEQALINNIISIFKYKKVRLEDIDTSKCNMTNIRGTRLAEFRNTGAGYELSIKEVPMELMLKNIAKYAPAIRKVYFELKRLDKEYRSKAEGVMRKLIAIVEPIAKLLMQEAGMFSAVIQGYSIMTFLKSIFSAFNKDMDNVRNFTDESTLREDLYGEKFAKRIHIIFSNIK